jgi:hypothetical protein
MSDLGLRSYYLEIEVKQSNGEIMLCQASYAKKVLATYELRWVLPQRGGDDAVQ